LLIPLYKEKEITIRRLIKSIRKLDYPKSKLDIKLIVEEDDYATIEIIKKINCERIFKIVEVPRSFIRTKPKALNYALKFAIGEYVAVYDAEDQPDRFQLKKALSKFYKSERELICVQGKLNYYNANENLLTRFFAIEYAGWFELMLPALNKIGMPLPLGGTSNHFIKEKLLELKSWDPYNVTEDADLGIRISALGYKTDLIDSETKEEAPITIKAWLNQRSRWIKGYLQTYIVHMRNPIELYKTIGFKGFLGIQFFIALPCFSFLLYPFILLVTLYSYIVGFDKFNLTLKLIKVLTDSNLVLSLCTPILGSLLAIFKKSCRSKKWRLILPYSFIYPFYWLLHSIASFKAFYQLIKKPHYWEKTEHGLSKFL
jgi:cellulose synthase/poly-beta-1,6-N-acetylglucosamine synthase-like glycosyltransferase